MIVPKVSQILLIICAANVARVTATKISSRYGHNIRNLVSSAVVAAISLHVPYAVADGSVDNTNQVTSTSGVSESIKQVPVLAKRSSELQQYVDLGRGFKLLRPFGYNEFQGSGGGYAVKFASLFEVDENVVVGNVPAAADKRSIADFGTLDSIGNKLLSKRGEGARLVSAAARETEGVLFYEFQFDSPLDPSLPRTGPRDKRPTRGVELYEVCVAKGRLWSVQATSNDRLFPHSEKVLRAALASFLPRL